MCHFSMKLLILSNRMKGTESLPVVDMYQAVKRDSYSRTNDSPVL